MSSGKLGMTLFLASETMFFVGLLGSFLVLQAGQRELFHHMASMMSLWETAVLVLLLIAGSAVVVAQPKNVNRIWIAVGISVVFSIFHLLIWQHLLNHHTVVQRIGNQAFIYDGDLDRTGLLSGVRTTLTDGFDIARTNMADIRKMPTSAGEFQIVPESVLQDVPFGPWRNNFFACYFLITVTHLVHLLGGILAMLWLGRRLHRGTASLVNIDCVHLYWHFVNIAGVLGLLLLYFA